MAPRLYGDLPSRTVHSPRPDELRVTPWLRGSVANLVLCSRGPGDGPPGIRAGGQYSENAVQRVAHRDEHVLPAIDRIGLGRIADVADARVPERLARGGSKAAKLPLPSPVKISPPAVVVIPPPDPPSQRAPPHHLAGSVVDRRQEIAAADGNPKTVLPPRPIDPRGSGSVR